eukprot:TRINITY_DN2717_c0_g1_i2.p1 TRINITY_DN2717_c0_g1~~TRINITY_DN2717_c0_g1_i2.p1  ORF type:complete len:1312 (-),score=302.93 TRINITY_DN2717_c0_g1_i2:487-4422(-)
MTTTGVPGISVTDTGAGATQAQEVTLSVQYEVNSIQTKYTYPKIGRNTTLYDLKLQLYVEYDLDVEMQILKKQATGEVLEDDTRCVMDWNMKSYEPIKLYNMATYDWETGTAACQPPNSYAGASAVTTTALAIVASNSSCGTTVTQSSAVHSGSQSTHKGPAETFVGLENQGATCYLNSLVQVLFMTPEFRRMIYKFPSPPPAPATPQPDSAATDQQPPPALPTTANDASAISTTSQRDRKTDIVFQLQLLFARMQLKFEKAAGTSALTTSFGWTEADSFTQHDVTELNRVLCDNLEQKMAGKKVETHTIAQMYRGEMCRVMRCVECGYIKNKTDDFYDVSLDIKGHKSILSSLAEYTKTEIMDGDNAVFCDQCQKKQKTEVSFKINGAALPMFLNLQLKRFEMDWERMERVKVNDDISFPALLQLDEFTVSPPQCDADNVHEALSEPFNKQALEDVGNRVIVGTGGVVYELFAVMIHSGTAGFGHYYAYIKNFVDGQWYKFNDETVQRVDERMVAATQYSQTPGTPQRRGAYVGGVSHHTTGQGTPYMFVYRRMPSKFAPDADIASLHSDVPASAPPVMQLPSHVVSDFKPIDAVPGTADDEFVNIPTVRPDPILAATGYPAAPVHVASTTTQSTTGADGGGVADKPRVDMPMLTLVIEPFRFPQVDDADIPPHVREEADAEWAVKSKELEESMKIPVTVLRNRSWLEPIILRVDKHMVLRDLMMLIEEHVMTKETKSHSDVRPRLALRRARQSYGGKRAGSRFSEYDMDRSLYLLNMQYSEYVYLEQDHEGFLFPDSDYLSTDIFIQLKRFNTALQRVEDVGDCVVRRQSTFGQFMQTVHQKGYAPDIPLEKMVLVHEIHRDMFQFMTPSSLTFQADGMADGDIVYVEELTPAHYSGGVLRHSAVQNHFHQQMEDIAIAVEETANSLNRRVKEHTAAQGAAIDAPKRLTTIISCRRSDKLSEFKQALSDQIGVVPECIRLMISTTERLYRDSKVLKGAARPLSTVLAKHSGSREMFTDVWLDILPEPETLTEDHRLINVKLFNPKSEFVQNLEVCVLHTQRIGDIKKAIQAQTGIAVERQLLTEWYDDHVFKIFREDTTSLYMEGITENDQLRCDEVTDPAFKISGYYYSTDCPFVVLQYCKFEQWQQKTHYSKTAFTSTPTVLVVPRHGLVKDLRTILAERTGVPYDKLSLAVAPMVPIYEADLKYMSDEMELKPVTSSTTTTTANTTTASSVETRSQAAQHGTTVVNPLIAANAASKRFQATYAETDPDVHHASKAVALHGSARPVCLRGFCVYAVFHRMSDFSGWC